MKSSSNSSKSLMDNVSIDVLLGRAAMLGFVLTFGVYLTVDVVSPGLI